MNSRTGNSTGVLYREEELPPKKPAARIDIKFERMVVACGIGCITQDLELSEADLVRLHLAISRLIKAERQYE